MNTKHYYDKISKGYNELYGAEQLGKLEAAKKLIKFSKKDKVLDVGCGTGIITAEIAKLVKSVTGVDVSKGMIDNALSAKNVMYMVAEAERLPFPDKSFDKVVSFTVLQDIKDWEPALTEMARVSKDLVLVTIQKRGKDIKNVENFLSNYFNVKKSIEEEKDFIFLLSTL
jgi:ubiquinone/menaquinone biosynthesis C-methylase UbiE